MILLNPDNPIELGMRGFHKWELVDRYGRYRKLVQDFMPNTILTAGRNQMSQLDNWLTACQVGTSNVAPAASQTSLQGYITGTIVTVPAKADQGATPSAPYYGWDQQTFRIDDPLIANEVLKEAGFGWGTSGDTLVARVLIVDQDGLPTTVTPLPNEILEITLQFRYYPPTIDVTGTVTMDSVVYNYILRAAEVTSTSAWAIGIGSKIAPVAVSNADWAAYDDVLGTVEQSPSGIQANCDNTNVIAAPYVNNSYEQAMSIGCGPTGWVLTGGVRSFRIKTTAGWFQIQLGEDPGALGNKLPKTINKVAGIGVKIAWTEKVLP